MEKINWKKLITAIVICQLAGVIGSFFTSTSVRTWYAELNKPALNPQSWVFSPVWITLFLLMGIALYIIWNKGIKKRKSKTAISFFGIQLGLNILWSALFFGLKSPVLAFIEIILLWTAILLTIIWFYRISKTSAYLLIPYILWVSFAIILNYGILILN